MTQRIFRRKKFLIKPGYQLKIVLTLALSFIVYSIILAFIIFYPLSQEFYASASIDQQARISAQIITLHTKLWPAVLLVAILMSLQLILTSHRFFGPIYRFEQTIKEFLKGDFSQRIALRKHDQLKEMEELLNDLANYMEGARSEVTEFHSSTKERLKEVSKKFDSGEETEINEASEILSGLINELSHRG